MSADTAAAAGPYRSDLPHQRCPSCGSGHTESAFSGTRMIGHCTECDALFGPHPPSADVEAAWRVVAGKGKRWRRKGDTIVYSATRAPTLMLVTWFFTFLPLKMLFFESWAYASLAERITGFVWLSFAIAITVFALRTSPKLTFTPDGIIKGTKLLPAGRLRGLLELRLTRGSRLYLQTEDDYIGPMYWGKNDHSEILEVAAHYYGVPALHYNEYAGARRFAIITLGCPACRKILRGARRVPAVPRVRCECGRLWNFATCTLGAKRVG